jgi:hypothetical protein
MVAGLAKQAISGIFDIRHPTGLSTRREAHAARFVHCSTSPHRIGAHRIGALPPRVRPCIQGALNLGAMVTLTDRSIRVRRLPIA